MKKLITLSAITLISLSLFGMSQKPAKTPKKLKDHKHTNTMKATGKSLGYFQVKVDKFDNGNGDVKFMAQILPRNNMNGEFKWQLPKTAKVTSGDLEGDYNYVKNQVATMEIIVDRESLSENDKIFFFAFKMMNGERHGGSYSLVYKNVDSNENEGFQKSQVKSKKPPKFFE